MALNKVRTSSMVKKKQTLKWWYAIPVVLIVAVVGYVVIVFSKASTHYYTKTVDNGGLKGGTSTTSKNSSEGKSRIVGSVPVETTYSSKEMTEAKRICARVFLGGTSQGKLTVASNGPVVAFSTNTQSVNFGTGFKQNSFNDICQDIDAVFATVASSYGAKVSVSQASGDVKVQEIWIEQN